MPNLNEGGYGSGYRHNKVTMTDIQRSLTAFGFTPKAASSLSRKGVDAVESYLKEHMPSKSKLIQGHWARVLEMTKVYKAGGVIQDAPVPKQSNESAYEYMSSRSNVTEDAYEIRHDNSVVESFDSFIDAYETISERLSNGSNPDNSLVSEGLEDSIRVLYVDVPLETPSDIALALEKETYIKSIINSLEWSPTPDFTVAGSKPLKCSFHGFSATGAVFALNIPSKALPEVKKALVADGLVLVSNLAVDIRPLDATEVTESILKHVDFFLTEKESDEVTETTLITLALLDKVVTLISPNILESGAITLSELEDLAGTLQIPQAALTELKKSGSVNCEVPTQVFTEDVLSRLHPLSEASKLNLSIKGDDDKPDWLKLQDLNKSKGVVEAVVEIAGKSYWYKVKQNHWNKFLETAMDNRGRAMTYLRNNNIEYKKLEV